MLVSDIYDMAKISSLANLSIGNNQNAIIKFIYLGVSELYRRFNLSIKVETILTNPDLALYELKNKDVSILLGVYDSNGRELQQTDTLNSRYDYKIINYRSFLLKQPTNNMLFAVYKAVPEVLSNMTDEIDLPDAMISALLAYVGHMAHTTINKDNVNESLVYYKKFIALCTELDSQGYRIALSTESIDLRLKGYV